VTGESLTGETATGETLTAEDDGSHPARRQMRDFIRRNGARGTTPTIIARLLELEGTGVAQQTIQRWLSEDEAAGLIVRMGHSKWRAKG
jgi:hypothetical protein